MWCGPTLGLVFCRCRLTTGEKGLSLAGPPRSGETSRLGSRDLVADRIKCRPHGIKKSKEKS
jgi:hypothetical protein